MSAVPRARSSVPLAQRSAFPTIPGVSAVVAVAVAVGCTFVGYLIDSARGVELTRAFSTLYFLGCVGAALIVRYRGLFTAVVQPPLILFVAVPLAYYNLKDSGTSMRDIALNVAYPLVDRFPLMVTTTVIVLLVGLVRFYFAHQRHHTSTPKRTRPRAQGAAPRRRQSMSQDEPSVRRRQPTTPDVPRTRRRQAVVPEEPRTRQPIAEQRPVRRARHGAYEPQDAPVRRTSDLPPTSPRRSRSDDSDSIPRHVEDYRATPPRRSAERRYRNDYPSHPMPQVRYREREEPPYSR